MSERKYPEAEMSSAVTRWLECQGFVAYTEIPYYGSCIDMVGVDWAMGYLVAVEMKTSLSEYVIYQAIKNQPTVHDVFVAVASKPREKSIEMAESKGVGVLSIIDGECHLLTQPNNAQEGWVPQMKIMMRGLSFYEAGGVAGLPCQKGVGPAQEVARLVKKYLEKKPDAGWREMFDRIPNHYSTYASMRGALVSRGLA